MLTLMKWASEVPWGPVLKRPRCLTHAVNTASITAQAPVFQWRGLQLARRAVRQATYLGKGQHRKSGFWINWGYRIPNQMCDQVAKEIVPWWKRLYGGRESKRRKRRRKKMVTYRGSATEKYYIENKWFLSRVNSRWRELIWFPGAYEFIMPLTRTSRCQECEGKITEPISANTTILQTQSLSAAIPLSLSYNTTAARCQFLFQKIKNPKSA